jgi:hypothetical protein
LDCFLHFGGRVYITEKVRAKIAGHRQKSLKIA